MSTRTLDYGIPADHDCADLLLALHKERYGPLRALERERFSVVVPVRSRPAQRRTTRPEPAPADEHVAGAA